MTAPQIITGSIVRRHLEAAGPTVAELVARVATDEPSPVPARTVALVERVEQIKAWALESSAREAARLLTEGARRCLLEIDDYREVAEWVGGEPDDLPSLRASGERLRRRVAGLGRQLPAWPALEPRPAALSLAHECLDLAELAKPGFEWARLQRGFSLRAATRWAEAIVVLESVASDSRDPVLGFHACRNVLAALTHAGQADLIDTRLAACSERFPAELSVWSYFGLEISARSGDRSRFQASCSRWGESVKDVDREYWLRTLSRRTAEWAVWLNSSTRSVEDMIERARNGQ